MSSFKSFCMKMIFFSVTNAWLSLTECQWAFAKCRCGIAPLRHETGRYEGLPVDERKCPFCRVHVEDEKHVLLQCEKYDTKRENLIQKAAAIRQNFYAFSDDEKLIILFSDQNMIRACAKVCFMILQRRSAFLYK